jgi:hypothetical protein
VAQKPRQCRAEVIAARALTRDVIEREVLVRKGMDRKSVRWEKFW